MISLSKTFSIILISALFLANQNLFSQASTENHVDDSIKKEGHENIDGSNSKSGAKETSELKDSIGLLNPLIPTLTNSDLLNFQASSKGLMTNQSPDSEIFKYKTTPDNPDHRCYEIVAPLPNDYNLRFNFMSLQKFTLGGSR